MKESDFQSHLIKELRRRFKGSVVLKNDPLYLQGFPDLLILFNDQWAALEVKNSKNAKRQPNQQYYIDDLNMMSFAAFIYPENEEEVLNDLQRTFELNRKPRIS